MMIPIARSLQTAKTFCTAVASLTLTQFTRVTAAAIGMGNRMVQLVTDLTDGQFYSPTVVTPTILMMFSGGGHSKAKASTTVGQ